MVLPKYRFFYLCWLEDVFFSTFIELLASTNYSRIVNTFNNATTISTNSMANLIQRLLSWIESGILNLDDINVLDSATALQRFMNGKTVFLRESISVFKEIDANARFEWDYSPIALTTISDKKVSFATNNGWNLGVYKHSANVDAAVKMAKYMTSQDYQRYLLHSSPGIFFPTHNNLLSGKHLLFR